MHRRESCFGCTSLRDRECIVFPVGTTLEGYANNAAEQVRLLPSNTPSNSPLSSLLSQNPLASIATAAIQAAQAAHAARTGQQRPSAAAAAASTPTFPPQHATPQAILQHGG